MKITQDEFSKLQKYWYERLSESGFNDLEKLTRNGMVLKSFTCESISRVDEFTRSRDAEYFHTLAKMVNDEDTSFRNEIDKYILSRYAEGAKIKMIVTELLALNNPIHRHSIRFIIRRYEMRWGVRSYSRRELNRKSL